jgi:hypothetical protein
MRGISCTLESKYRMVSNREHYAAIVLDFVIYLVQMSQLSIKVVRLELELFTGMADAVCGNVREGVAVGTIGVVIGAVGVRRQTEPSSAVFDSAGGAGGEFDSAVARCSWEA